MSKQKRSYSSLKMLGPFSTNGLKRSKKKKVKSYTSYLENIYFISGCFGIKYL